MSAKKTHEMFLVELNEKNPSVNCVERYNGARERILFKCAYCGYTWKTTPDSVLRGSGS